MLEKVLIMLHQESKNQEDKIKIEQLSKMLEQLEDNDQKFELLKEAFPTIFKNKEIMLYMVSENADFIRYDETNDPDVYKLAIQLKRDMENPPFFFETDMDTIDALIQELADPKEAPNGKYKVPKEILFDLIRKEISSPEALSNVISDFLEIDCNYPQQYCEEIERLFLAEDDALLMHEIDNSTCMSEERIEDIRDKIFIHGLKGTSARSNLLSATTVANMLYIDQIEDNQYYSDFESLISKPATFFDFLKSNHSVFLSVPKEAIRGKIPIWYSNFPNVDSEHPGYIPAKYVVGYNYCPIDENGNTDYSSRVFLPNKVIDRAEYPYSFIDGETTNGKNENYLLHEIIYQLNQKIKDLQEEILLLEQSDLAKKEEILLLKQELQKANSALEAISPKIAPEHAARHALQSTTSSKSKEATAVETSSKEKTTAMKIGSEGGITQDDQ